MFLNILMASVMCLQISMQEEDIIEQTDVSFVYILINFVDHCVT